MYELCSLAGALGAWDKILGWVNTGRYKNQWKANAFKISILDFPFTLLPSQGNKRGQELSLCNVVL